MALTIWKLEGNRGKLARDRFSAAVDAASPEEGVCQLLLDGHSLSGAAGGASVLSVNWSPPESAGPAPSEVFVRDADLVAFYGQSKAYPFRREIYWRSADTEDVPSTLMAMDLVVSIQTDLLDSHPSIHVNSRLPSAREALTLAAPDANRFEPLEPTSEAAVVAQPGGLGCVLLRLPPMDNGIAYSYAEMVHPGDLGQMSLFWSSEGQTEITHLLLSDFLEKGVIRRARLRGVFLDREGDAEAAANWYRALVSERLPLTT